MLVGFPLTSLLAPAWAFSFATDPGPSGLPDDLCAPWLGSLTGPLWSA